jgi:hypothetical protein
MNTETVIYSQTYSHKGHEYVVWSYTKGGGMSFACQGEGLSLKGLDSREEAVRQARKHLDHLPAEPAEHSTLAEAPQASQEQQQQSELALA